MRFLIVLCVAAGAWAQGSSDCGAPFQIEQMTFKSLEAPPSAAPGVLKNLFAYVGDIPHNWKLDGPNSNLFRIRVFSSEKWRPSRPKMTEGSFVQQAKEAGLQPWTATVKTRKDIVRFFAYKEAFYLEVVKMRPSQKGTEDSIEIRVCKP